MAGLMADYWAYLMARHLVYSWADQKVLKTADQMALMMADQKVPRWAGHWVHQKEHYLAGQMVAHLVYTTACWRADQTAVRLVDHSDDQTA